MTAPNAPKAASIPGGTLVIAGGAPSLEESLRWQQEAQDEFVNRLSQQELRDILHNKGFKCVTQKDIDEALHNVSVPTAPKKKTEIEAYLNVVLVRKLLQSLGANSAGLPGPVSSRRGLASGDQIRTESGTADASTPVSEIRIADLVTRANQLERTYENAESVTTRHDALSERGTLTTRVTRLFQWLDLLRAQGIEKSDERRALAAIGRVLYHARSLYAAGGSRDAKIDALYDRQETEMAAITYELMAPTHQTAIESEVSAWGNFMGLLDTYDGTVGPVIVEGGRVIPDWLRQMAGSRPPDEVLWRELPAFKKLKLLEAQFPNGKENLALRRTRGKKLPGLMFKRHIPNRMQTPVSVDGRRYEPGAEIAVPSLEAQAEYGNASDMSNVSVIEAHIRRPGPAGQTRAVAATLSPQLGKEPNFHQHLWHRLPIEVRHGDESARARYFYSYSLANLVLEFARASTGQGARRIWKKIKETGGDKADNELRWIFDHLKTEDLAGANRQLRAVARGKGGMKYDDLKDAAIGMRPGAIADVDVTEGVGLDEKAAKLAMMSWEIRTDSSLGSDFDERFADRLQKGVLTGDFGPSRTQFEAWYNAQKGNEAQILSKMYFNRPHAASDRIRGTQEYQDAIRTSTELQRIDATNFGRSVGDNYYLRMLVHDWANEPILFNRPDLQEQVFTAQKQALRKIATGSLSKTVIAEFVEDSDLFQISCGTAGLDLPAAPTPIVPTRTWTRGQPALLADSIVAKFLDGSTGQQILAGNQVVVVAVEDGGVIVKTAAGPSRNKPFRVPSALLLGPGDVAPSADPVVKSAIERTRQLRSDYGELVDELRTGDHRIFVDKGTNARLALLRNGHREALDAISEMTHRPVGLFVVEMEDQRRLVLQLGISQPPGWVHTVYEVDFSLGPR